MKITQTSLPNKLRVLSTEIPDSQSVAICIFVGAGSRFEVPEINGVSHFLEHLFFLGTEKRPTSLEISRSIEGVGGELNAYTSEDKTCYYVRLAPEEVERGLDTLTDMLTKSLFPPEKVEKERGVVIEEINLYQDDPSSVVGEILPGLVWPDSPLGFTVIGPKEVIQTVSQERIQEYRAARYRPENMVVSIAGPLEHARVEELAARYLGDLKSGSVAGPEATREEQTAPRSRLQHKETDQTHLIIALRALSLLDKQLPALRILSVILGGGMSSRLFQNVREQKGLAYSVYAGLDSFLDTGLLYCKAGVNNDKVPLATGAILDELKRMKNGDVTEEDLQRTKDQMRGSLKLSLDGARQMANWTGSRSIITGKPRTIDEVLTELDTVTLEQLKEVGAQIITDERLNFALVGPNPKEQDFAELLTVERSGS